MVDALKVLSFDGALGIKDAMSIKEKVTDLISKGFNIIVNLSGATSIDLACIQVLLAAAHLASSRQLSLQIANQVAEEVLYSFYICGISKIQLVNGKELNRAIETCMQGGLA